jgi:tRNA modification GTPase
MFCVSDTIVAVATPPGRGGIGVVRLSGPDAHAIARRLITHDTPLEPRHATLTTVRLTAFAKATAVKKSDSTYDGAADSSGRTWRPALAYDGTADSPGSTWRPASAGPAADAIDQAVVTFFPAPHSYTGDDVVELSAHGSPVVLRAIVEAAIGAGARLAEPGEFTLRAFLNGRIDLVQAEAVRDLIDAATPLQARAAFDQLDGTLTRAIGDIDAALFDLVARLEASVDFPDEGYHFLAPGDLAAAIDGLLERTRALLAGARRGRLIREGLQVVIVGAPNVGKSSLFNALVGSGRAIVTDIPGTTRDLVTDVVDIEGLRVTLVDTAGLRDARDPIEAEGVARSHQAVAVADLVLVVEDQSRARTAARNHSKALYVANKSDLPPAWSDDGAVPVSARTGAGLDALRERIVAALDTDVQRDRPALTNVRHIALVERAQDALARARVAAIADGGSMPEEFVLADLAEARAALEEISGRRATEDLLAHIFQNFCVGK